MLDLPTWAPYNRRRSTPFWVKRIRRWTGWIARCAGATSVKTGCAAIRIWPASGIIRASNRCWTRSHTGASSVLKPALPIAEAALGRLWGPVADSGGAGLGCFITFIDVWVGTQQFNYLEGLHWTSHNVMPNIERGLHGGPVWMPISEQPRDC